MIRYPGERQWAVIFLAYVGLMAFVVVGLRTPATWWRIAIILATGLMLNLWRHSRKYPKH